MSIAGSKAIMMPASHRFRRSSYSLLHGRILRAHASSQAAPCLSERSLQEYSVVETDAMAASTTGFEPPIRVSGRNPMAIANRE